MFDSAKRIFVPPSDRGIGMVFQSYAIWPHMTVFENVAFPLRVSRAKKILRGRDQRPGRALLDMVQLGGYARRPATQLSGGQQQRLALARGLVHEPAVLLLDEPLSNLDAKLREQMRLELKRLQRTLGITTVYVTHDQSEALALSDEIAVFNSGRIVQRGTPQQIYSHPSRRSSPTSSARPISCRARCAGADGGLTAVETAHGVMRCLFAEPIGTGIRRSSPPGRKTLYFMTAPRPPAGANALKGKIVNRVFLGEVVDYIVDLGDRELRARVRSDDFQIGQTVTLGVPAQKCVGLRG